MKRSLQEFFAASYIANSRENLKVRIYGESLREIDNSESQTFWELCEELDESCFNQYFLIPILEKYVNNLEKINDPNLPLSVNKLNNYLHDLNVSVFMSGTSFNPTKIGASWISSLAFDILLYIHIGQNMLIVKLIREIKNLLSVGDQHMNPFVKDNKFNFSIDDKRPEVITFYEKSGVLKCCEEYIKQIKHTIDEKNRLIKSKLDNSIAILDLLS